MNLIAIHFDGGCQPNPGHKYGSFEVLLDGRSVRKVSRMSLGFGTNNEAEFEAMIEALEWTASALDFGGFKLADYTVKLFTDSTIVRNRVLGRNKTRKSEPQARMNALAVKALEWLIRFKAFGIEWHGRENNVARFGH